MLFTRFHRVDIDVDELEVVRSLPLSDRPSFPSACAAPRHYPAASTHLLRITGGIHTGLDVVKATMAGAHATQMVRRCLRHGPVDLRTVRRRSRSG